MTDHCLACFTHQGIVHFRHVLTAGNTGGRTHDSHLLPVNTPDRILICSRICTAVQMIKDNPFKSLLTFCWCFFNQTSKLDTRNISRLMSNPSDLNIRVLTCTSVDWHSKSISHKEGGWMGYSNTVKIYHTNKVLVLASSFSSFFHDSKWNVFMCLKMLLENETGVFNTQQIKRNKELS